MTLDDKILKEYREILGVSKSNSTIYIEFRLRGKHFHQSDWEVCILLKEMEKRGLIEVEITAGMFLITVHEPKEIIRKRTQ